MRFYSESCKVKWWLATIVGYTRTINCYFYVVKTKLKDVIQNIQIGYIFRVTEYTFCIVGLEF